jgi:hypothetical protein
MSVTFPEEWEYRVVDPEIAEVLGDVIAVEFPRGKFANVGFRFGDPDGGRLRMAPERPASPQVVRRPRVLPDLVCPCGLTFRPRRGTTVYCSNPCRRKYVGLTPIRCAWCRSSFRPKRSEVMFCSRACACRSTAANRGTKCAVQS